MLPWRGLAYVEFYGMKSHLSDFLWEWGALGGLPVQAFSCPCPHPMTANQVSWRCQLPCSQTSGFELLIPLWTVNLVAFCILPRLGIVSHREEPRGSRLPAAQLKPCQLLSNTGGPVPGVHINSFPQPAHSQCHPLRSIPGAGRPHSSASVAQSWSRRRQNPTESQRGGKGGDGS